MTKADNDNRSRQLNPKDDAYWRSRGYEGRPKDTDDQYDDWGDDEEPESSESEKRRLSVEEEARKREADEAQKEIKRIEGEAVKVAEKMLDTLFRAYELALKLKATTQRARVLQSKHENYDLYFNEPMVGNISHSFRIFLERAIPFSRVDYCPPTTPLRNKIMSIMKEYGF